MIKSIHLLVQIKLIQFSQTNMLLCIITQTAVSVTSKLFIIYMSNENNV